MRDRILKGWTLMRALYLMMGILIIVQALMERQWLGSVFGGYFASMGLFGFGCASGNCYPANCATSSKQVDTSSLSDITYEEVK